MSKEKQKLALRALAVLNIVALQFPGLIDGEEEVNGADLVDALTAAIADEPNLTEHLTELTLNTY